MTRHLLTPSHEGGPCTIYVPDQDGVFHLHRVQDVEPILEDNKRRQNDGDGYSPSRDLRYVAHIPNIFIEAWMKEGLSIFDENCWPAIRRRLNDPDWRFLRTSPGRI